MTDAVAHARDRLDHVVSRNAQISKRLAESALAEQVILERARREARRIVDAESRPPAELPEILSLRERRQLPQEPTKYRIEQWQPAGGRVVLAAQYKAGKTTLVGNLVRALVDGDLFLDRALTHKVDGAVAVLDVEMPAHQVDRWLIDQRITNDDRVVVVPLRGKAGAFDIIDPERRAEWATLLRERGVCYVVLDCLRPVLDSLGLDENHDAGRFLVAFDALLAEAGVAEACIVHHMGHSGERSRGDSRIRDWPDAEWRLVREDPENPASPRFITAIGRDVEQPETRLTFDVDSRRLTLAGGSRRDADFERAYDAVTDLLKAHPATSGNAIEQELTQQHTRSSIRTALARGVATGLLRREKGERNAWCYHVNEVSSPVRRSSPGELGSSSPPPIGGELLTNWSTDDEQRRTGSEPVAADAPRRTAAGPPGPSRSKPDAGTRRRAGVGGGSGTGS